LTRLIGGFAHLRSPGRGQTVEITGEPGIGKSRLALELIDKTDLPDASIVALQASAQHQNTPLYPTSAGSSKALAFARTRAPRPILAVCANSSPERFPATGSI
jgi:ABC-type dipeptide/oligopeptide/nickel transport system ATPase component